MIYRGRARRFKSHYSKALCFEHSYHLLSLTPTGLLLSGAMGSHPPPSSVGGSFSGAGRTLALAGILSDFDGTIVDSTAAIIKHWGECGFIPSARAAGGH